MSNDLDTNTILQEIRELRQRIDDGAHEKHLRSDGMPEVYIKKDPPNPSSRIEPTKFPMYGGDKSSYPAWRRAVLSALRLDWNTFTYTDSRVFLMIYKALEGKAQRQAAAYYEAGGEGGKEKPEDFIRFLDRSNWDPTRIVRARAELSRMKMGPKQEWNSFFPVWANKLTESHGDNWPDETKITMLRSSLNKKLRSALASNHLVPSDDYYEWIRIVGQIAMQHEELTREYFADQGPFENIHNAKRDLENNVSDFRPSRQPRDWSVSGREQGPVGGVDSSGDTFMGGVNVSNVLRNSDGKPLRAKWKSKEQIARLRGEGRCFRCEQKGCNTRICRLLPAKKINSKGPMVSNVTLAQIDPDIYEVDEEIMADVELESEN